MHNAKLRKALLAAAENVNFSDSQDTRVMFDALVNLELLSRTAVEEHLIETALRPEWRAMKATASTVYHKGNHVADGRTLAETAVACQIDR